MADDPFPLEREQACYLHGMSLFNQGRFFETHEVWEEIWNHTYGTHKLFYQGLIQCAVALEHLRRGNAKGARSLFRSSHRKFASLPPVYMGLDIWSFIATIARTLAPGIDSTGLAVNQKTQWPTMVLRYDPFQSGEADRVRRGMDC